MNRRQRRQTQRRAAQRAQQAPTVATVQAPPRSGPGWDAFNAQMAEADRKQAARRTALELSAGFKALIHWDRLGLTEEQRKNALIGALGYLTWFAEQHGIETLAAVGATAARRRAEEPVSTPGGSQGTASDPATLGDGA